MSDSTTNTIKVHCPSCNKKLGFASKAAGRTAKCPACEHVFRVNPLPPPPAPPAAATSSTAQLSETGERIRVHCPQCGKALTFLRAAAGRKAKCSACDHTFRVTLPETTPTAVLKSEQRKPLPSEEHHAKTPAHSASGHGADDLFGDLAKAEEGADLIAFSPEEAAVKEAVMTGPAILAANRPVKLEYDKEVADSDIGILNRAREAMGPLVKGCVFSFIGALIGGALWAGTGIAIGMEVGYIAWLVGLLAGWGMNLGTNADSPLAGAFAAFFSLCGIALGRVLIIVYFIWPQLMLVKAMANPNSPESKRVILVDIRTQENLSKMNIKYMVGPTEKQETQARDDAKKQVAALSDAEVRKAIEKHEMEEARKELVSYKKMDFLSREGGSSERQAAVAGGQAATEVDGLSDVQVQQQLAQYRSQGEKADDEDADDEAGSAPTASTSSGKQPAPTGSGAGEAAAAIAMGFFELAFGGFMGLFITLIAMGTAFKIGGWGFAFGV